jgi:ABC-type phosphate transport system, periplasmic component
MKKIISLLLIAAMALSLAACGGNKETEAASTTEAAGTEAPATQAPVTEAPTTEAPTTEAPATEAPTTEAPATEAPATEAPTTEAPTTEAPATEPDTTKAAGELPIKGIDAENWPWIDGSTANHPLLARIYREICGVDKETSETMVSFNLNSTGSIWEAMLTDKEGSYTPDLWIVYEAPEDVKERYKDDFDDFEIEPLGRDGLVFMVNVNNTVNDLSVQQLYDIYTGKLTDWSEVGGEPGEIKPFQRNEDSGSQTLFMKLLMKGDQPMEPPTELKVGTMGGLIDQVAAFDGSGSAIGFSVYYYANLMHANPALKLISVDGVEPTNKSIESAQYPLTNDFYVVIRKSEPADSPVRALRDWLLSPAGRAILEDENYVWAREGMD